MPDTPMPDTAPTATETNAGGIYRATIAARPTEALDAVGRQAEDWGGAWDPSDDGGRLGLPARAGLRLGWLEGTVTADELDDSGDGPRCRVTLRIDHEAWRVDRASVMFLALALFGVSTSLIAPFVPRLWPLVPMGVLLGIGAWLFIVARLRNSGPEEFMDLLDDD